MDGMSLKKKWSPSKMLLLSFITRMFRKKVANGVPEHPDVPPVLVLRTRRSKSVGVFPTSVTPEKRRNSMFSLVHYSESPSRQKRHSSTFSVAMWRFSKKDSIEWDDVDFVMDDEEEDDEYDECIEWDCSLCCSPVSIPPDQEEFELFFSKSQTQTRLVLEDAVEILKVLELQEI